MASRGNTAQKSQMFVADFETCDSDVLYKINDKGEKIYNQRVWLAGLMSLEDMTMVYYNNLDDFMGHILGRGMNVNTEYAFHNLKFDGSFIVPWLFKNGYTVTKDKPNKGEFSVLIDYRNNWYSITIQVTTKRRVLLWDSLKLFPTPLEYLPELYGTPTHKIAEDEGFYNTKRGPGHTPTERELEYLKNDLMVLAETLNEHIRYYGLRFKKTQASQSFNNFEKAFPAWKLRFPPLTEKIDERIRPAYWGGISYVNPVYAGKDMYNISVFDINSSYPYQLAYKKLPYGSPVFELQGEHPDMSKFWVAEVIIKFKVKEDKVPCIPLKAITENRPITRDLWVRDSEGLCKIRLCVIDYYNINDCYEYEIIEWKWAIHFAWKIQPEVAAFILKNNEDKVKYKKMAGEVDDVVLKQEYLTKSNRAKIDNNAFYGKFGEDIIKEGKTPYWEEWDEDVIYRLDRKDVLAMHKRKYLPVAMATTAWGRRQLITMANAAGSDFIYCDTDSVHMLSKGVSKLNMAGIWLSKTDLGAWDKEGEFDRARFLRPKCYYEENIGETPEVTIAGLPADPHTGPRSKNRSFITWDNFHIGLEVPEDKANKLGTVSTPTGNKLVPVSYKITDYTFINF